LTGCSRPEGCQVESHGSRGRGAASKAGKEDRLLRIQTPHRFPSSAYRTGPQRVRGGCGRLQVRDLACETVAKGLCFGPLACLFCLYLLLLRDPQSLVGFLALPHGFTVLLMGLFLWLRGLFGLRVSSWSGLGRALFREAPADVKRPEDQSSDPSHLIS